MSSSVQLKNTSGGYKPVDPNDPKIQEVAAWAIAEHNKQKGTDLVYKRTLKAAREDMIGSTRYFIDLEASEGCKTNKYYAQVLEIVCQTPTKELEVFMLQENAPIPVAN
ncbi:putative cysteine proteinase inhibitor 7 [Chenopodium quinoa]|uniref:putative cysteine proteinase inhibitor 7 n=1 Tax=Chenopodium quinoa TaxID=63459 RepID=UPI000B76F66D|nr:putative cysteine proteinase inhibitor 7 [Chenopodium quinoa]